LTRPARAPAARRFCFRRVLGFQAFISHSWRCDPDEKWTMLQAWRARFVAEHEREPTIWFDKACIAPGHLVSQLALLPIFAASCNRFVVLLTPSYLSRLWCAPRPNTHRRARHSTQRAHTRTRRLTRPCFASRARLCVGRSVSPRRCVAELFVWMHVGRAYDIELCLPRAEAPSAEEAASESESESEFARSRSSRDGRMQNSLRSDGPTLPRHESGRPSAAAASADSGLDPTPADLSKSASHASSEPWPATLALPLPPGSRPRVGASVAPLRTHRELLPPLLSGRSFSPCNSREFSLRASRSNRIGPAERAEARTREQQLERARASVARFDVRAAQCTDPVAADLLLAVIEVGYASLDTFNVALRGVLVRAIAAAAVAKTARSATGISRKNTSSDFGIVRAVHKAFSGDWGANSSGGSSGGTGNAVAGCAQRFLARSGHDESHGAPRDSAATATLPPLVIVVERECASERNTVDLSASQADGRLRSDLSACAAAVAVVHGGSERGSDNALRSKTDEQAVSVAPLSQT
jgi:hypothetical protein